MATISRLPLNRDAAREERQGRIRGLRTRRRRAGRPLAVLELERRTLLSTFTVTDTLDNTNVGSLRWAIGQVNADTHPGTDTIKFKISGTGVQVIAPTSPLPTITHSVLIDGFSQPGYSSTPLIELSGSKAGGGDGLTISTSGVTVRGLDITNFSQGAGIHLTGTGATGDWVYGDFLGVDPTGKQAMPNDFGVEVDAGASTNLVGTDGDGGDDAAERNLISGNLSSGVWINGSGTNANVVAGNFIGTDISGTIAVGNGGQGIEVDGPALDTTIGGTASGTGNLISGNGASGVWLVGNGTTGNLVEGNKIGTKVAGTAALGNALWGVILQEAASSTIGGTTAAAGNLISGNNQGGVAIRGIDATGDLVEGNLIGTEVSGGKALGNAFSGVYVGDWGVFGDEASNDTIGGTAAGAGNIISANGNWGVWITGNNTTGIVVQGNLIGTDITGKVGLGNAYDGIDVDTDVYGNTVGGDTAGAGNVISANGGNGIALYNGNNPILGNRIGVNAAGTAALGNHSDGIFAPGYNSTIGGTNAAAANVIGGNGGYGVDISNSNSVLVQGNFIGTDVAGTLNLGNVQGGVEITEFSSNNSIGGLAAGQANTIAFNGGNGVTVGSSSCLTCSTVDNGILSNSIYSNSGLGIDLGDDGVTLNTPGGPHNGPNDFQNFPVLTHVVTFKGSTYIIGTFNSTPNATFTLQFFLNHTADPSGYGQGQTLVDTANVSTDGNGNASFFISVPTALPAGQVVSATATDSNNDTSEFSQDLSIVASSTAVLAFNVTYNTDENTTLNVPAPGVLGNDIDLLGNPLSAVLVTSTSHGSLSFQSNGSFTYTPNTGFLGADTFTYYATDGTYKSSVATATINVNPKTYVVTNINDSGVGSLRWAITQANLSNTAPPDTINFKIPGTGPFTIQPLTPLPVITHPTVINGYTQPGSAANTLAQGDNARIQIDLDGSLGGGDGLAISAGGSTVKGLAITDFANGIHVTSNGGDLIIGNFLGTNPSGKQAGVGNQTGVLIDAAGGNTIGWTAASGRNLISGNSQQGVLIDDGSSGNRILGNLIGTDATGESGLANFNGVVLTDSPEDTVGGTAHIAGNVISANGYDGILLNSAQGFGPGSSGAVVQGNFIGTDATGTVALGNGTAGIDLEQASNSTIGGTYARARNIISGNSNGIYALTTGTRIQGNFIGTDVTGTKPIGNTVDGIATGGFEVGTTIGGSTSGSRNVISANGSYGIIDLFGTRNLIQGDFIGTDVTGTQPLGNGVDGLNVSAVNDTIGETSSNTGNVISANGGDGVDIVSSDNLVVGNRIGTDVTGSKALGNAHDGVAIGVSSSSADDNSIGGTAAGAANIIAFNGGNGVTVGSTISFTPSVGNAILSNSIYSNGKLGIDLNDDGVTLNTPGGPHTGPNELQNFPVLYASITDKGMTYVKGTLNSTPNSVFTVQFFANAAADPSGYGQGRFYIGQGTVVTDASGNANFQFSFKVVIPTATALSATATDPNNNTSEFAADVPIVANAGPLYAGNDQYHIDFDTSLVVLAPGVQTNDLATNGQPYLTVLVTGPADGSLTLNADGSFSYTPNPGFIGVDQFTYKDVQGSTVSNVATVTIDVNPKTYVVTNTNDSGSGSLRQAILGANLATSSAPDTIDFDIPGTGPFTISPLTPLPELTHATIVDGYSQPGSRANNKANGDNAVILLQLNGSQVQSNQTTDGLAIAGGSSTVEGLSITGFGNGIHLLGSGSDLVTGNFIGLNPSGGVAGNSNDGVFIGGVPANTIGGSSAAARNVISNNGQAGIYADNSLGDLVLGNFVGTDPTGTKAEGNNDSVGGAIAFVNSPFGTVGGSASGAGNLVSGNHGNGVYFDPTSTNALVQGNLVGTAVSGTVALGNSGFGLEITSYKFTIGGTTAGARNVISGNQASGINLDNETSGVGSSNLVEGNDIGVDTSGTKPLGNGGDGIDLTFMSNLTIGGATARAANVISSNGGYGINIFSEQGPQVIEGNDIGTDRTGTIALGNHSDGVYINSAVGVTIGGTAPVARNIISANGGNGVHFYAVSGGSNSGDVVEGNSIGTNSNGTIALGNSQNGVLVDEFTVGILIGGTASGTGNIIADNAGAGVEVLNYPGGGFDSDENGILSNSIFGNGALGIDLGGDGVTANHSGGPISGPNEYQNYPVLSSATSANGKTTITGTLNSAASTSYLIQFFSNPTADPSGYGQGKTLIGSITVTTDSNGNASFTATFSVKVPVGEFISSTATDPNNNTSEFSQDVTVTASSTTAAAPAAVSLGIAPLSVPATVAGPATTDPAPVNQAPASSPSLPSEDVLEAVAQELILTQRRKRIAFVASESSWKAGGSV